MSEKLEVPEEMQQLMDDWVVYIQCRDEAIRSCFRAKRAIYYGRLARKANVEFWGKVAELYPHTSGMKYTYNANDRVLTGPED